MHYSFLKTIIFLFVFIIAVMLVDRYFFDQKLTRHGSVLTRKPFSYIFVRLEDSRFFFRKIAEFKNTARENETLKRENLRLLSQLADYENTKDENSFLRKALNLAPRLKGQITYASIYQFRLGLGGYEVLVNKGSSDNISVGNIVLTEDDVLIGRIEKVYDKFSQVTIVNDRDFSVAVKVLSSGTAGIAKGAMAQGMYLDLIVSDDPIKEGDTIVSTGLDFIPPSLVVGTVSYVEINEADVFKKVKIRPAMGETKIGRVLVISHGL